MQHTNENATNGHIDYFLDIVARNYVENESDALSEFCFIFPNKRAGLYFRRSLRKAFADRIPYLEPEITTITDFVASFSDAAPATQYEQLFILYNVYKNVLEEKGKEASTFDKFAYWGEMLLRDFDEIDKNLVNASDLFVNYERFKEIESNYLTKEQKDVLKFYFGETFESSSSDFDKFWKSFNSESDDNSASKRFYALWMIINDIYQRFDKALNERGISRQGKDYRNAAETLAEMPGDDLEYKRYVFVGFNVLSKSEIKIMKHLQEIGFADFCWDYNSPAFRIKGNHACRFMDCNVENFPARYDCNYPEIEEMPRVKVIASPSLTGMVKSACKAIRTGINSAENVAEASSRTALVLPDESMLIPVVDSISVKSDDELSDTDDSNPSNGTFPVNITMGYPLRNTHIAALINDISKLHLNCRKIGEQFLFFYNDVVTILSSPVVRSFAATECDKVLRHIRNQHIFNIPEAEFETLAPSLKPIFTIIIDLKSTDSVFNYLFDLIELLSEKITGNTETENASDDDDEEETQRTQTLNEIFLAHYRLAVVQLFASLKRNSIEINDTHLLFQIIDRVVGNDAINFTGEPIGGLQILGILETRAINFSNVHILSMNEKVFPRQHFSNSFIPDVFRRAYGLPTIADRESISAYYFYRLISRADNVSLYYVSSARGLNSGEMSRYITQLQYLFPDCVEGMTLSSKVITADDKTVAVKKTKEVLNVLALFRTLPETGEFKHNITVSSLKGYLECRLRFYFDRVKQIRIKEEFTDYIDDRHLGTIVHASFEKLYSNGVTYDSESLRRMANSRKVDDAVVFAVNKEYNLLKEADLAKELKGEASIVGQNVRRYVVATLNAEANMIDEGALRSFRVIQHEKEVDGNITLRDSEGNNPISINVRQFIDRLDEYEENGERVVRVIDYKTGSDDSQCSGNWQQKILSKYEYHVIFQLLFYCEVMRQCMPEYDNAILNPVVYMVKKIPVNKTVPDVKLGNVFVRNYDDYRKEFCNILYRVVAEIFNPAVAFDQSSYNSSTDSFNPNEKCNFCNYNFICNKKVSKKNY